MDLIHRGFKQTGPRSFRYRWIIYATFEEQSEYQMLDMSQVNMTIDELDALIVTADKAHFVAKVFIVSILAALFSFALTIYFKGL